MMKPIEIAQARRQGIRESLEDVEFETDESEHSFSIQDVSIGEGRMSSLESITPRLGQIIHATRRSLERKPPDEVRKILLSELVKPPGPPNLSRTSISPLTSPSAPSPFAPASVQPPFPRPSSSSTSAARPPSLSSRPLSSTPEDMAHLDPSPYVPLEEEEMRRRSLHLGQARSVPLRISIDLPKNDPEDGLNVLSQGDIHGRLVRRRRRLPLQFIILFGIVGCYAAVITTLGMSLSAYNFSKIRVNRAKEATDQLRAELMPLLLALQAELRQMNQQLP